MNVTTASDIYSQSFVQVWNAARKPDSLDLMGGAVAGASAKMALGAVSTPMAENSLRKRFLDY